MDNKKIKILVFTGAGISAESGLETFRSGNGALWNNFKVEDIATSKAWRENKENVLNFYNDRRAQLREVEPNIAHKLIAGLEEDYDITIVSQNVDNLHERAGSTNVIHLHGELSKSRSTLDLSVYDCEGDIKIGDKCERGGQLRPHIILFDEALNPDDLERAKESASEADICIIIGTSMLVSPARDIPFYTREETLIYYVDPGDVNFGFPTFRDSYFSHYQDIASIGVEKVINDLKVKLL